jgi:hypothetical protein
MTDSENKTHSRNQRLAIALLTSTVFLGAALLFSMEPLVGRLLTPYFGGAAHVWLTCLMFFQAMLLLGYLYAHLLVRKLGAWHLLFLLIPLVSLPLRISTNPNPGAPALAVLATLVFHVGLPFVALSTTAVVAQTWLSNSPVGQNREPYPLYAASNAGSLLMLLGYAFLIEPLSGLRVQSLIWSGAYLVYVLLVLVTWFQLRPTKEKTKKLKTGIEMVTPRPIMLTVYLQWLLLSALPSAFLLATTNYITLEVGSFPFVWVIPLSLYLASFIVTFRTGGGVPRTLNILWIEILLFASLMYFAGPSSWLNIVASQGLFFAICLVAHGNLYARRPGTRYLTNFYLTSALGGWIGGVLVTLVAPFLFTGLFEYPILLFLFGVAFWWCHRDDVFTFWRRASFRKGGARLLLVTTMVTLVMVFGYKTSKEPTKFRLRNFYGAYRVKDQPGRVDLPDGLRMLYHGRTVHGAQLLRQDLHSVPTTYFHIGSGISDVFETTPSSRRVAIIGLGCGTVSTYAKQDDTVTYYEIDPDIERIARQWFTYLNDCKGRARILIGDGRLLMQSGEGGRSVYDIIMLDAFSGDGIPTHLLTREAIEIYLSHLSQSGIMVFNMSNRYYDLRPVLKATATELGLRGAMKGSDWTRLEPYQAVSSYVVLTRSPERLEPLVKRGWKQFRNGDGLEQTGIWTDNHINIIGSLKLGSGWTNEFVEMAERLKQIFRKDDPATLGGMRQS